MGIPARISHTSLRSPGRGRGAPSLVACERLVVAGDVAFGRGVVVRGSVRVEHDGDGQLRIEDGTVLED